MQKLCFSRDTQTPPTPPHPDTPRHALVDNNRSGNRNGGGASCRCGVVHW